MHRNLFSSEVELSKFLGSIDIIPDAYRAISRTSGDYQLHTSPSGIQILAFNCPGNDYTARFFKREFDLVSSKKHTSVDFISAKVNKIFSINKDAVELFEQINPEDIKKKVELDSPLIITGQGLGGYPAIFFALWLQNVIDVKESNGSKNNKRPICITFGSPLVGDKALQLAIAERPQWKSSFLNVVAKKDSIASLLSLNSKYKPFGTFMFCTESGGHSAFEDQESVIAVLDVMASSSDGNMEMYDYGNVLSSIKRKVLYRGVCDHFGGLNMNSLKAGITLQFKEVDVLSDISNDLIEELEKKQERAIINKKNAYEPTKSLNEMKISLTYMEWYMKTREPKGGYYDCYKNATSKEEIISHQQITTHKRRLNQYWRKTVEQKNLMPQKEGAKLRKRWLYGGTNYRRIVEPLDIAEHYKNGNVNYIKNRQEHYNLLESWSNEEKKDSNPREEKRTKAASLTEDSCFWAHVEEALILLKNLKNGGSSNNAANIKELETFEADLMRAINNYFVSPTIFLEGSSLMMWWKEYKEYKGGSYASDFAQFMNTKRYESYK